MLLRAFTSLLIVVVCATSSHAQENDARPDGWRGAILNLSTPDDTIRLFGTPAKDKDRTALEMRRPVSWLSDKYKQKVFRTLTYKKLFGYKQAQFSFLDGKLVMISLEAQNPTDGAQEWIDPDELESLFVTSFKPHARRAGQKLPPPSVFRASAPAELKKDDYAYWYDMIAVGEDSFIVAVVDNYQHVSAYTPFGRDPTFEGQKKERERINAAGKYPGFVSDIQIISRGLAEP